MQQKKKKLPRALWIIIIVFSALVVIGSFGEKKTESTVPEIEPTETEASSPDRSVPDPVEDETDPPETAPAETTAPDPAETVPPEPEQPEPQPLETAAPEPDQPDNVPERSAPPVEEPEQDPEPKPASPVEYVLNTSSHKIHKKACSDVDKINPENYAVTTDPAAYLASGYTNCGHCGGYLAPST